MTDKQINVERERERDTDKCRLTRQTWLLKVPLFVCVFCVCMCVRIKLVLEAANFEGPKEKTELNILHQYSLHLCCQNELYFM